MVKKCKIQLAIHNVEVFQTKIKDDINSLIHDIDEILDNVAKVVTDGSIDIDYYNTIIELAYKREWLNNLLS